MIGTLLLVMLVLLVLVLLVLLVVLRSSRCSRLRLFCHHVLICLRVLEGTAAANAVQSLP